MDKKTAVAAGVSIAAGSSLAVYALYKYLQRKEESYKQNGGGGFNVIISEVEGGTVQPAPGVYTYGTTTTLHLVATPQSGYDFQGWFVNGEVVSASRVYDYTISTTVTIIASFLEQGAPILLPASIKPVQHTVAEDHWRIIKAEKALSVPVGNWYINRIFLESYEKQVGFIKFKIQDANGNGVPNLKIALYTDHLPDINQYGYLLLNDAPHAIGQGEPLIVTSDANGIATAKVSYWWYEGENSDYRATIGPFTRIYWSGWYYVLIPIPTGGTIEPPIHNDTQIPTDWGNPALVSATADRFERLRNPLYYIKNVVHAYWVDNPNLTVLGDCFVDCVVRLDPSGDVRVDKSRTTR